MGGLLGHRGILLASAGGGGGGGNVVTWNPADKNASISLAGGDLQASGSGGGWISARATHSVTVPSYFEVHVANGTSTGTMIGLADLSATLASYFAASATGWSYNEGDGQKYNNGSGNSYSGGWNGGDVISVYYDPGTGSNGIVGFWKNGVSQGDAFTNLPPGLFPAIAIHPGVSSAAVLTGRFKSADFGYTPPVGYPNPWGV